MKIYNKRGYIALTTVLILGAIGTLLATSLLLVGTIQTQTTIEVVDSYRAKAYANGCAEEALKEISLSTPYAGTDTIIYSNGSCGYEVFNTGGQNRRIESFGVAGASTKRVIVVIDAVNPNINTVSWQEVISF